MLTATTIPARTPRLTKLTSSTMTMASISAFVNSPTDSSTTCGWLAMSCGSIPTGRSASIRAMAALTACPMSRMLPPLRHR